MDIEKRVTTEERVFGYAVLAFSYVVLTAISTYSLCGSESVAMKAGSLLFIALAFAAILITPDKARFRLPLGISKYFLIFTIATLIWTYFLYVYNMETQAIIVRGSQKLLFQLIVVVLACIPCMVFGEEAVRLTYYGMALCYVVNMGLCFMKFGPSESINSFIHFVTNEFDAVDFMKKMEVHDASFSFSLFLPYFLLWECEGEKRTKRNLFHIVSCLFFCFMAMKRIALASNAIVIAVWFVGRKLKDKQIKTYLTLIGIGMMVMGVAYVIFTATGALSRFYSDNGINDMSRSEIYAIIRPYYELSPFYLGKGYEYITKLFENLGKVGTLNLAHAKAMHNGYLTQYIEIGAPGFLFWMVYWMVFIPRHMMKYGGKAALAAGALIFGSFITYLTDNTAFYFFTGTTLRLIIICMAQKYNRKERRDTPYPMIQEAKS